MTEGYILCIPCFRRLEGILKLRCQLAEERLVENAIDHGTLTSLSAPDVPGPSAMRTPPRSKRARVKGVRGSTPRRRRRIDTPIYQACNSKVATCSIPNCCGE